MPLLASPLASAGRRVDHLARLFLPFALLQRWRQHPLGTVHPGPVEDDRRPPVPPSARAPGARARRARSQAAEYLARRRSELRRDLDARR